MNEDLKNQDLGLPQEKAGKENSNSILQVMSGEDAYIVDRMKSQPKTLEEIVQVKEARYAPGEHRLSLPKEFVSYQDRFGFRWVNKKKRAVDEALLKGWVIVNRTLFPNIVREASYLFSSSGAVEKGDLILACIAKQIAEEIRVTPGKKSTEYLKAHLAKGEEPLPRGKGGFYKPQDTGVDDEGGMQEGRDF